MVTAMTTRLKLVPPEMLEVGGEKIRIGGGMYRALARLLAVRAGANGERRVKLATFVRAVWGDRDPPDATLRGLLFRINEMFRGLGSQHQVGKVDVRGDDFIVLR
jgi:hypothetical protein